LRCDIGYHIVKLWAFVLSVETVQKTITNCLFDFYRPKSSVPKTFKLSLVIFGRAV